MSMVALRMPRSASSSASWSPRSDEDDVLGATGVAAQVDGLARVAGRPSRHPQRGVVALGPRVLDQTTEGHDGHDAEGAAAEDQGPLEQLAASQRRRVERVA